MGRRDSSKAILRIFFILFLFLPFFARAETEYKPVQGEITGISEKTVQFSTDEALSVGERIKLVRGGKTTAVCEVVKIQGNSVTAEILEQIGEPDFDDTIMKVVETKPPAEEEPKKTVPEVKTEETKQPETQTPQNETTPAASQFAIIVVGRGITKKDATNDALRNAIEKVAGVMVFSVTDVKNFKIVKDKIVATSQGYIKNYDILSEEKYDDMIVLKVSVTVDQKKIQGKFRESVRINTYDDVLKDYNMVTQKVERLKSAVRFLKSITSRPLDQMYSFDYMGYKIEDIGLNAVKGQFFVRVALNPFFWDTYDKIIEQVDNGKFEVCGSEYRYVDEKPWGHKDYEKDFKTKVFRKIHEDLRDYLLKDRGAIFQLTLPDKRAFEYEVILYKNLIGIMLPNEMLYERNGQSRQDLNIAYVLPEKSQVRTPGSVSFGNPEASTYKILIHANEEVDSDAQTCTVDTYGWNGGTLNAGNQVINLNLYSIQKEKVFSFPFAIKEPDLVKVFSKIKTTVVQEFTPYY